MHTPRVFVRILVFLILSCLVCGDAEAQALKLDGTATCFRALLEIADQYGNDHEGPELEIRYGGAFIAVEKLGKREIDMAVIEYPLRPYVDEAWAKAFPEGSRPPAEYTFAQTALGVVVHKRNPLSKLSHDQMKDILSGKTRTWQALGGSGASIRVLTSKALSGSMASDMILHYGSWHGAVEQLDADANVIASVMADAAAIGFVALTPDLPTDVKVVAVAADAKSSAVPPTVENVVLERYPLVRQYKLLLTEQSPPAAHDFAQFACSDEAQKTVHRWGLFPATIRAEAEAEQRVADVKAGKGQPVVVCDMAGVGETLKAAALEFARAKMAVQVTLDSGGGSAEAVGERLKTGAAELLVVDGGMDEELRGRVTERGGAEMVLGSRAVGVVVHPASAFNELTMDDLRQILAGKVDRWPGATGTAERIVLYALPPANPLMPLVDRAMGPDAKRAKVTVRPNSERVILSVASQPGALGLVDLTKVARHETKVKLLAILPPGETEADPPSPRNLPNDYPLARPVYVCLSGKASEATKSFFAFLNEGGARDALLVGGLVPRDELETMEGEIATAYGAADGLERADPPAQVAAVVENDSPATTAPDHLQEVLRGALGGPAKPSPSSVAPAVAPARTDQTAEDGAAVSTPPNPTRPASQLRQAEKPEAIHPAPGEGGAPHPAASQSPQAGEEAFAAWATAHAVPIGLVGLGVVAVAVALGSIGMKRARHRDEVMRRYRP